jgi:endonuclease YncB( thermonuclease family)
MMNENVSPKQVRAGRIGLTLFFVVLALLCLSGTYLFVPVIRATYDGGGDIIPRWRCIEVLAGDTIRVTDGQSTNLVYVAGIRSPPPERGKKLDEAVDELKMRDLDLLKKGQVAQKSLYAWINRRRARLAVVEQLEPGVMTAFVYVGGVDLGRKLLENGQAYVLLLDHPQLARYQDLEAEAQRKSIGLWR